MKNAYLLSIYCLLMFSGNGYIHSQSLKQNNAAKQHLKNTPAKTNWLRSDVMPDNILAFEENKGQFPESVNGWTILYGCTIPGIDILLTNKGIIYNISQSDKIDLDSKGNKIERDREPELKNKITYQHIFIGFEGCSGNTRIEAQSETPYYFNEGMNEHIQQFVSGIKGFKKIIYHDLYPGIDVEFTVRDGKGIKYAIIVKPGFDVADFKMHYTGTSLFLDNAGNLHLKTLLGDIVDKAPTATSGGSEIASSFQKVAANEVSFKLNNASKTNGAVIDPWTVFPVIGGGTYACDVCTDVSNNSYVLEYSNSPSLLMYVQKYNPVGGLIWTYTLNEFTSTPFNKTEVDSSSCSPSYFSDFVTDQNGNSYVVNPLFWANPNSSNTYGLVCINTLGQRSYLDYSYSADSISETWNMSYSCADSLLIEAGCLYCCDHMQVAAVNTATGNPYPGEYANISIGEVYAGTIAPNGLWYGLTAIPNDAMVGPDNLVCCNVTHGKANFLWQLAVSYPDDDFAYMDTPGRLGTNGIAASCSYLYTTDGLTLDQRDLTSGAVINTTTIPKGNNMEGTASSGLAVDLTCGNVYAGSDSAIYIYDKNLNPIGSYINLPGRVLDVIFNNGIVSACGENNNLTGFIVQLAAQTCATGITITHTDATCRASNGSANASATFCTGPYTYLWSPSSQTTQTATGLSAGIYTVSISPAGSCFTISDTVTIGGSGPAFTLVPAITDTTRCLSNISISVVGGISPYTYQWSSGPTTSYLKSVSSGNYIITVTDSGGCAASDTVKVGNGVTGSVSFTNALCPKLNNGVATVTVTGGSSPFTYLWSNGETNQKDTGLVAGKYYVTVTDSAGCKLKDSITITSPTNPTIKVVPALDSICADSNLVLKASGGKTYTWLPPTGLSCYNCSSPTANPSATITYTVTGTDSNGCVNTATATIKVLPIPKPLISGKDSVCQGLGDTLTVTGGSAYLWSNGSTSDSYYFKPYIKGDSTVYVKVVNSFGCPVTDTFKVKLKRAPVVTLLNGVVCPNSCITLTATAAGNGNSFLWSNGATSDTTTVCPDSTTTYSVTVSNGCATSKAAKVTVAPFTVYACCDKTIFAGDDTILVASGGTKYQWEPINGVKCKNPSCDTVVASPTVTTTYTVTATDANGCTSERVLTIIVETTCFNLFVPNVFTPNGDGINDLFSIQMGNLSSYSIIIYDRWGKEMYRSTNQYQYWNGNTEGGEPAPDGVYYYLINATCQGNTYKKDGFVQLIK